MRGHRRLATALLLTGLTTAWTPAAAGRNDRPLQLVESVPTETTLQHEEIPDAADAWPEMIAAAQRRIDLAHFYASDQAGSRLTAVVEALEAAADRGVAVRFLIGSTFRETYPELIERFTAHPGIDLRLYDVKPLMGGVLHAKMMIVDDEAFVGSQNFDWRALEHIQELGLRIDLPAVVKALSDVFETDWALAGGGDPADRVRSTETTFPIVLETDAGPVSVTPVISPKGWLPDESLWDLPRLVELIDGATRSVRVQLLSYSVGERDGTWFGDLDNALRRAATRGVSVQLLVADWSKRRGSLEDLKSLQCLSNVEVRFSTIPEWSGGFLPFSRVIHAKYLVVDAERFWLGTSNWSRDYFYESRNVGVIVAGGAVPRQLDAFFGDGWNSPYVTTIDPGAEYEAPRRSR